MQVKHFQGNMRVGHYDTETLLLDMYVLIVEKKSIEKKLVHEKQNHRQFIANIKARNLTD